MRWVGVAATLAAISVVARSLAQAPPNVELVWSAPSGCPSSDVVLDDVRALVGASPAARSVRARAAVKQAEGRWHLDLAIQSDEGAGERSIDADSCVELARAVALIVALAIDPTRDRVAPPASVSIVDAGPPPAPRAPRNPKGEDLDGPRLMVGAAGVADFGTMPSPGAGGAVSLAASYHAVRVEARGGVLASQRVKDPARPAQGVDLAYLGLDGRACFAILATGRPARDGIDLSPCLGIDIERLVGAGFGAPTTFSDATARIAFEGGILGTWALASMFALRVGFDLILPTSRSAFVVVASDGTTAGLLHRPAPVTGRLDLGAEVRFW